MATMYDPMVNSPVTTLAGDIDAAQTTITIANGAVLPAAPNIATIGLGEDAETILYGVKSGNLLQSVTRGFQGTAKIWTTGTKISRNYTAYDHDAFKENIEDNATQLVQIEQDVQDVSALAEANATQLAQKPSMTTAPMTLYVSTDGNNSNDGLTPATALRNIQTAINKIPQVVNHEINIILAGGTYDEPVLLYGFMGKGAVLLKGGTVLSNNYVLHALGAYNSTCTISLIGINAKTISDVGFNIQRCLRVNILHCSIPLASEYDGILVADGTRAVISNCNIANRNTAMHVNFSTVFSINNTGGGNQIGILSAASTVYKEGTQPTGTVNESTYAGGVIR